MITLNDLKLMDAFLEREQRIVNYPGQTKRLLHYLRTKIAKEFELVKVKIDRRKP